LNKLSSVESSNYSRQGPHYPQTAYTSRKRPTKNALDNPFRHNTGEDSSQRNEVMSPESEMVKAEKGYNLSQQLYEAMYREKMNELDREKKKRTELEVQVHQLEESVKILIGE